jgi:hypothetical protein
MILLIAMESKEVIGFSKGLHQVENCFPHMLACGSISSGNRTHGRYFP